MMSQFLTRRDFSKRAAATVSGVLVGELISASPIYGQQIPRQPNGQPNDDQSLVLLGLNGLARAHSMSYFADGHKAASLIAAHLMCVENDLEPGVRTRIVELFNLNWANTKLCEPFPEEDPDPTGPEQVAKALADGGEVLRQVGHNAIFAMLAIKAFRMLPAASTPKRIDGICKLIRSFTPWRDVAPDPSIELPPFNDLQAASRFVLHEASDSVDRFVGYGQGFAGHMLTFGQSLTELAAMGDVEWANSCRTAFHKYVTVTRQGPAKDDRKIKDHKPSKLRPTDLAYWQQRGDHAVGIGHVFKYPYSYYDLLDHANDPTLENEWDAKAWHVF